jgi:pimeloyl-ACP methyl ester carboxylesterase
MSGESEVVGAHRGAGRSFDAGVVTSFVREQGQGEPVVCMHGVPASSFLYRKVLAELAPRSLRGIAFDLPGLGLAARPRGFDYSWTGLGRFAVAAVNALALGRFHLVVHDIGGPVGFEMAVTMPERVASLTILNTIIAVDGFRRPWSMQPFAVRGVGELWLASITKPAFRQLMYLQGIGDRDAVSGAEVDAYLELLKREDRGRAFLKIMRGFERSAEKQKLYERAVRDAPYPVQVVWGANDPALKLAVQGEQARRIARLETVHTLAAKHFLQEDQAPALAELIARHAAGARVP